MKMYKEGSCSQKEKTKHSITIIELKALKAGYEAELRPYFLNYESQVVYMKKIADLSFKIAYLEELIKHETD